MAFSSFSLAGGPCLEASGFALSSGSKLGFLCSAPPTPLSSLSCILLQDLHQRLKKARLTPPLEDSRFHYGFNSNYLKKILSYWQNEFDWRKQVEVLNRYPHFKTKIEGMFPKHRLQGDRRHGNSFFRHWL